MPLKFHLRKKRDKGEKGASEGKAAGSASTSSAGMSVGKALVLPGHHVKLPKHDPSSFRFCGRRLSRWIRSCKSQERAAHEAPSSRMERGPRESEENPGRKEVQGQVRGSKRG